jgi:O-antigen/teichoic acid export membrane protein
MAVEQASTADDEWSDQPPGLIGATPRPDDVVLFGSNWHTEHAEDKALAQNLASAFVTAQRDAALSTVPPRVRRFTWGLADQAMSSITNAFVSIYIARELGAVPFGAFSLAYLTYAFALNASRGLATDPLVVRFSNKDLPTWRRAVASATGTATLAGFVLGVGVLGVAVALSGTARLAFLALGITLPGLLLQDSWRYAFFALGRGSRAFFNDAAWAVVLIPELIALKLTGHANVFSFVLAWGAAATVAAAIGPLQARVLPRPTQAEAWIVRHRDLGPRYLAENTANSGAGQLRSYGLGLLAGLAAVGYVQAGSTLMSPFIAVLTGITLVTVPEANRMLRRSIRHLRLFCMIISVAMAVAALAWGVVLLIILPRFGQDMIGSIWRPTYPLILPYTIVIAATCVNAGASTGLRALGASRRSLRSQVIASAAYVVASLLGAHYGGALGAVQGTAFAVWLGAAFWWWQLLRALRDGQVAPLASKSDAEAKSEPAGRDHHDEDERPAPGLIRLTRSGPWPSEMNGSGPPKHPDRGDLRP